MVFLLNAIFSVGYLYIIRKYKLNFLLFIPIIAIWIIIIGLQYGVGTDYFSYYELFTESDLMLYYDNGEYLFYYLVHFLRRINISGQGIFLIFSIIQNTMFYIILKKINLKYNYVFVFLFLTYGYVFYNQMNALRSYTALYFITFFIVTGFSMRGCLSFLTAYLVHASSLLVFPLIFLKKIIDIFTKKRMLFLLYISIAFLFFFKLEWIEYIIANYIPSYSHYLVGDYYEKISISSQILKLIYIPVYMYSLKYIPVDEKGRELFTIGFIGNCIRLAFLKVTILNRIGSLFGFLLIIPIYYLIIGLVKDKKYVLLFLLLMTIICLFIFKVLLFPTGEYEYSSYLFKYYN